MNDLKRSVFAILRWGNIGIVLCLVTVMLTGCLYSSKQVSGTIVSYRDSVDRIQRAVDQFKQEREVLPIITAGDETPRYEKFRINLDQLQKTGYLDEIPSTAFEKGGSVYFLLLDEEVNPTVKVMDLPTIQKINDVQRKVTSYWTVNGKLPILEQSEIYSEYFIVDLKKADALDYAGQSVYSGQEIRYIVDLNGRVYIDYALDIMQAIDRSGVDPTKYEDLRAVLTEQSYYVPVKSLSYTWENDAPVINE